MNKLGIYISCAALLLFGFLIDYSHHGIADPLNLNVTQISKATFLESVPNKGTLMLGFSTDDRTKQRKLFNIKKIGFDSLQVLTNERLYFEEPDIAYIMKYYRDEIKLRDTSLVMKKAFIEYVNTADSFTACSESKSIGNRNLSAVQQLYAHFLFLFFTYYGLYCFGFFLMMILNLRFGNKIQSKFIFLIGVLIYSMDQFLKHKNNINSITDFSLGHKVAILNLYETHYYQNWSFLLIFIIAVIFYRYYVKIKLRKSKHFYALTLIYFFSALMISFLLIEKSFGYYFIYKFQEAGYGYNMSFYTALPLSLCISIGMFLTDKFGLPDKNRIEKLEERVLQSEAELTALQSSINPHFLYNSLNSITALVDKDPDKTKAMSIALSNFYKYTTNRKEKSIATIAEEINMIQNYLAIEKIRFGDRLQYKIDIDEESKQYSIPYFMLQPIIENAIKYGYESKDDIIDVRIKINVMDSKLELKVFDSGKAFDESMDQGYGLRNVTRKLKLLYPNEHVIEFINKPKHVSIIIKLNSDV